MAVHVAARIQGLAGPGDILVSSTVKDIVVGSDARFEESWAALAEGYARRVATLLTRRQRLASMLTATLAQESAGLR
jgi:class 3 adenylate cyclase